LVCGEKLEAQISKLKAQKKLQASGSNRAGDLPAIRTHFAFGGFALGVSFEP
jgi:hypothetical protein